MPVNVGVCMNRGERGRRKEEEGGRQRGGAVRELKEQGGFDGSELYLWF